MPSSRISRNAVHILYPPPSLFRNRSLFIAFDTQAETARNRHGIAGDRSRRKMVSKYVSPKCIFSITRIERNCKEKFWARYLASFPGGRRRFTSWNRGEYAGLRKGAGYLPPHVLLISDYLISGKRIGIQEPGRQRIAIPKTARTVPLDFPQAPRRPAMGMEEICSCWTLRCAGQKKYFERI